MDTASALLGVIDDAAVLIDRGQEVQARELLLAVSDALARRHAAHHGSAPSPSGEDVPAASTE